MYRQPLCGNTHTAAALPPVAIPGGALPLRPRTKEAVRNSDDKPQKDRHGKEKLMANRQRNLGINIRVTPAEKKKIERNAKKCRLTVSEYLRKLAMNIEPKELPSKEIEESFLRINDVINDIEAMKTRSSELFMKDFLTGVSAKLLKIMIETLQLMMQVSAETEVKSDGND
jgi:hypothetical protein